MTDFDFEYTHYRKPVSSLVDEVWYNSDTKELAVSLHDEVYVYSGVPLTRYQSLIFANSVGREYQSIKREFGPSEYLGDRYELEFGEKSYEAPDMGSVGTPKGLTYAENAVVHNVGDTATTGNSSGAHISLTYGNDHDGLGDIRRHRVVFETPHGTKAHEVNAESVAEAKSLIESLASDFGLSVTVKEVTVFFE